MKIKHTAAFLMLLFSGALWASTNAENIELARINAVLNAVYPLIEAARTHANKDARSVFDYAALTRDIQTIQKGIAAKINEEPFEPQAIEPMSSGETP